MELISKNTINIFLYYFIPITPGINANKSKIEKTFKLYLYLKIF